MGNNIDIILIALVAIFLVLRLRSVLGRRTGNERPPTQDPFTPQPPASPPYPAPEQRREGGNVVTAPRQPDRPASAMTGGAPIVVAPAANDGVARIRAADASFDPIGFGRGARSAFEMIVGAFARGDAATLRTLLDDATFASFDSALRERQAQRHSLETSLIGFLSSDIVGAVMEGSRALVTIRFVTEQINVTRDADGLVVDGNPNTVVRATDTWTFARDTRSDNPNWLLVRTESE